jgi:hypothetical protein
MVDDRHAGPLQRERPGKSLGEITDAAESAGQMRQRRPQPAARRGVEKAGDLAAGRQELGHVEQRQWTAAGDPDRLVGNLVGGLEQDLRGANGQHARQRPARKGHGPFLRAGRQDHGLGRDGAGLALSCEKSAEAGFDLPELAGWLIGRAAGAEGRGLLGSGEIGRAQAAAARGRGNRLDGAPDLSARRRLVVDDEDVQPVAAGGDGGGHAGRPCADDEEIDRVHALSALRPCWRVMRIPAFTGVRQVWVEATPSTSARHSKHTPIMQ